MINIKTIIKVLSVLDQVISVIPKKKEHSLTNDLVNITEKQIRQKRLKQRLYNGKEYRK